MTLLVGDIQTNLFFWFLGESERGHYNLFHPNTGSSDVLNWVCLLLEAFGKWRELLDLNFELNSIWVKFELNLKVFEVFYKKTYAIPSTVCSEPMSGELPQWKWNCCNSYLAFVATKGLLMVGRVPPDSASSRSNWIVCPLFLNLPV